MRTRGDTGRNIRGNSRRGRRPPFEWRPFGAPQRMLRRACEGRRVIYGSSSLEVTKGHHHGVQHVRDVERGEFQVGTLRDLLGLAVTFDLARTADAPYLVREHKSPDRNNPVQGVWRQEQRCSLWCDHLRGLQRLLQAVPVVGRQLSMSAEQELRGRPCKQKPVPVLSAAKVPTPRHV